MRLACLGNRPSLGQALARPQVRFFHVNFTAQIAAKPIGPFKASARPIVKKAKKM
jgi:hypothetical protein